MLNNTFSFTDHFLFLGYCCSGKEARAGSAKANMREPKTGLGQVFNFKLGCFDDEHVLIYADASPHLQLKTLPRFCPVSLILSMATAFASGKYLQPSLMFTSKAMSTSVQLL